MGRPRTLTAEQEIELIAWWQSCKTVKEKCRELGISTSTFQNILIRHGVIPGETYKDKIVREYFTADAGADHGT